MNQYIVKAFGDGNSATDQGSFDTEAEAIAAARRLLPSAQWKGWLSIGVFAPDGQRIKRFKAA